MLETLNCSRGLTGAWKWIVCVPTFLLCILCNIIGYKAATMMDRCYKGTLGIIGNSLVAKEMWTLLSWMSFLCLIGQNVHILWHPTILLSGRIIWLYLKGTMKSKWEFTLLHSGSVKCLATQCQSLQGHRSTHFSKFTFHSQDKPSISSSASAQITVLHLFHPIIILWDASSWSNQLGGNYFS